MQARFQILQKESNYWDRKFIVRVSGACVTLHNTLVRMQKYSKFYDDDGDVYSGAKSITQTYGEERNLMRMRPKERLRDGEENYSVIHDIVFSHEEYERTEKLEEVMVRLVVVQEYSIDHRKHFVLVE